MMVDICHLWKGQCNDCPFLTECTNGRDNMQDSEVLRNEIEEKIKNLQIMLDYLESL